ncbi:uncharacterized protein LOC125506707 [Triticum urartu]|uniref:uncharacterized protein LOC125506707 n=1 Tax=Triticum urartu TaxID=4572 RepID=UPI00204384E6|nr:uncharacterized protein LOC125506707 [Triticum urartu]
MDMEEWKFPESSYSVAVQYAEETMKLQGIHRNRAQMGGNQQEDVFGGYVRSYGFNYDKNSNIAQGSMSISFSHQRWRQLPVTVVILGAIYEDGKAGQRIVERTAKLSELSDLVHLLPANPAVRSGVPAIQWPLFRRQHTANQCWKFLTY